MADDKDEAAADDTADNDTGLELVDGRIRFDYIKSNSFRVIHVDGAHGGVLHSLKGVHMAVFSERNSIPKSEEYELVEGKIGSGPMNVNRRDAIVREVEADLVFDLNTARAIRDWLTTRIGQLELAHETVSKISKQ